jgi:hypothetical protein
MLCEGFDRSGPSILRKSPNAKSICLKDSDEHFDSGQNLMNILTAVRDVDFKMHGHTYDPWRIMIGEYR